MDPEDHGGKETSGTGFFTYGLAWGINNGILDSATYMPPLVKAWNGMAYEALHSDGFLGYVQSTGKQPSDGYPFEYDKPANFEDYGLGAFLLAGSETWKLAPDTGSMPAFTPQPDPTGFEKRPGNSADGLNLELFPNPASDSFILHHDLEAEGELEVSILNAAGEKVESLNRFIPAGDGFTRFSLPELPRGLYLAVIKFGDTKQIIRFIKS